MSRSSLNVLVLGLAAVLTLAACDRGEKRNSTANGQLVKAQCVQGFDTKKFADKRVTALSKKSMNEKVLLTYVYKLETKSSGKSAIVDETSIKLVSSQTLAAVNEANEVITGDEIIVKTDCATLTAEVTAPGLKVEGLKFVASIGPKNKITLEKIDEVRGKISVVIENVVVKDSAAQSLADATGETTLKLTFTSPDQNLEIIQKSGMINENSKIELDASAVKLLKQRLGAKASKAKEIAMFNEPAVAAAGAVISNTGSSPEESAKPTPSVLPQATLSLSGSYLLDLENMLAAPDASFAD